jgi:hypothetical protein
MPPRQLELEGNMIFCAEFSSSQDVRRKVSMARCLSLLKRRYHGIDTETL